MLSLKTNFWLFDWSFRKTRIPKNENPFIEAIDKLLLEIDLDPKPLLEEAASLEKELQKVTEQVPTENNNPIPRYIG